MTGRGRGGTVHEAGTRVVFTRLLFSIFFPTPYTGNKVQVYSSSCLHRDAPFANCPANPRLRPLSSSSASISRCRYCGTETFVRYNGQLRVLLIINHCSSSFRSVKADLLVSVLGVTCQSTPKFLRTSDSQWEVLPCSSI